MNVEKIMSTEVVTIASDSRLDTAKALFEKHKFHNLLVTDKQGCLVGVLSDRDLFKAISPHIGLASERERDLATLNKRVHQIATRKVISATNTTNFNEVINLFKENKISCIPVVSENNKPVGIVSWRDIINVLYQKLNKQR